MAKQFFRLAQPGISSISHDGREHIVNDDGLLEVDNRYATPSLLDHLKGMGSQRHYPDGYDPNTDGEMSELSAEERERQILFAHADIVMGHKVDRRRSLPQLRELIAQHYRDQEKKAAKGGPTARIAAPPGGEATV